MNALIPAHLLLGITLVGATYAKSSPSGDFICFDRNQNLVQLEFNDDQNVNFIIQRDEKFTFSGTGTEVTEVTQVKPAEEVRTFHDLRDENGDLFPHLGKIKVTLNKDATSVEKIETMDSIGSILHTYSECRLYDPES
jgi:hypothetical protein